MWKSKQTIMFVFNLFAPFVVSISLSKISPAVFCKIKMGKVVKKQMQRKKEIWKQLESQTENTPQFPTKLRFWKEAKESELAKPKTQKKITNFFQKTSDWNNNNFYIHINCWIYLVNLWTVFIYWFYYLFVKQIIINIK